MPFIQRYSDAKKDGIVFCGNAMEASNVNYAVQSAAMIAADITAETGAVKMYEEMLSKITNPVLNTLISRI